MGSKIFNKIKNAAKKARENDKIARQREEEGKTLMNTIMQIKAFFALVGAVAPLIGYAAVGIVCVCAVLLPIIFLSQLIGGAVDAVKEFGTSLGNLFTTGCYGTDEECLEREEAKKEEEFKESVEEVKEAYRTNKNNEMNNELYIGKGGSSHEKTDSGTSFSIDDVEAIVNISGFNNSVMINVPVLVSSLMYFETTVSSYEEMQQENMICDKLIALGFLEEEGANCGDLKEVPYEWYDFAIPEEDKQKQEASGGYLKSEDTLADQTGVDVYKILKEARPAGVTKEDKQGQCGNFNSLYTEGFGIIYNGEEDKSLWDSFVEWIDGDTKAAKVNRLRSLSKFSIKRNVTATCSPEVSDPCPDGYIKDANGNDTSVCSTDRKYYYPKIAITVTFAYNEDRFRKYLEEEYVPSSMLETYLFDEVENLRYEYEKTHGSTVEGTGDTKAFLNDSTPKIKTLGEKHLERREAEKEKNEKIFADVADDIIELASIYEDEWQSFNLISAVCPGVTVTGEGAGTYNLEDYIAGVVANEAYTSEGMEALKAQAVAARSYLLKTTNNCTKSIENSTSQQTFNQNPNERAKQAAYDTAGEVLTSGGEVILAMYDSFCNGDSDCPGAVCTSSSCTAEYTKLPGNEKHTVTLTNPTQISRAKGVAGYGHAMGMSQLKSYELAAEGKSYSEILAYFYSSDVTLTVMASGAGLEEIDGFPARTSRATRDNPYFYGDGAGNEGECAWYAVRRTNEILGSYGSGKRVSSGGNGGDFCTSSDYQQFEHAYDINQAQPGDVISWKGGSHGYGHVAVIEAVYRDSSGNVTGAKISEGGIGFGNGIKNGASYNGHTITRDYIWGLPYGAYKNEVRAYNCEYPNGNGTGCQNFRDVTKSQLLTLNGYAFQCIMHIVG